MGVIVTLKFRFVDRFKKNGVAHDDTSKEEFYTSHAGRHKVDNLRRRSVQHADYFHSWTLLQRGSGAAAEENPSDRVSIGDDAASESIRSEAIRLALRELGYIEGQNIAIEYRYAEGKRDRFPELAAELVRLKVDIIVAAGGDQLVRVTKNATKTIPIVMVGARA